MKEILLTSSALILALLVMRRLFHEKISRRVQYALWGFVLLRLLLPVQLPAADFSILSVSEPARAQVAERLEQEPVYVLPVKIDRWNHPMEDYSPGEEIDWTGTGHTVVSEDRENFVTYAFTLQEALDLTWKIGMGVMGAWMLLANLRFWRKLRKSRIPLELPECRYPVYLMEEGLVSPCLFGLVRPAVYLTPAAMENEESLRHVLAHEEAHGRHWDPLWALLRNVCLAVYWFDPLVWWAAAASKEDCELACDEGALKRLGEAERFAYGRTLLSLIGARSRPADLLSCATTMTGDGKTVAQRVKRIAQAPKRWLWAAVAAVLLAGTVTVCAFGRTEPTQPPEQELWPDGVDVRVYTRDLGGFGGDFNIRLNKDGTFSYYEGLLSSFIGMGTWIREGNVIRLADERDEDHLMYHYFTLEEDALVFRAGESVRFMYVDVADGERFSLTYAGTDPVKTPDAQTDSPAPTPEQAVPMEFSLSLNEGATGVDLTGLDCGSAFWGAELDNGMVIAGRRDLMDAEMLGYLTVTEPRFLGEKFAAGDSLLFSVCYPEEGPLLFFGFDEHGNGPEKPVTASVYAFVDLSDGTVREKGLSGFESGTEEFSDELLVRTAQRLALIIEDTADYYDRAAESQKALEAERAQLEDRNDE